MRGGLTAGYSSSSETIAGRIERGDSSRSGAARPSSPPGKNDGRVESAAGSSGSVEMRLEGGGCSGFQYKFDIDHAQAADDLVIRRDGATVLIDQISVGYLAGSEIDFVDDLIGASFRINNPQATASCGCGTSFSL